MELWTSQREHLGWTPWSDVSRGLASLLDAPNAQVLLLTEAPEAEHDLLVAALRLVHALAANGAEVVVASPHPSADLIESLAPCGVDQVWVVERRNAQQASTLVNISALGQGVCSELHAKTEDGTTISVCGCRRDRMVLARHHLNRWCLGNKESCPHWLERVLEGRRRVLELESRGSD